MVYTWALKYSYMGTPFSPKYMGGCPNYDPFLGALNIRCHIFIGIRKGTIILTTTHIATWSLLGLELVRLQTPEEHHGINLQLPALIHPLGLLQGLGCTLLGLGFRDFGFGFRVWGFQFWVLGLRFFGFYWDLLPPPFSLQH